MISSFDLTTTMKSCKLTNMKLFITLKEGGEVREAASMDEAVNIMTQWAREIGGVPDFRLTRSDVVCDFCSEPGIVSLYQITPGTPRSTEIQSDGTVITHMDEDGLWGACATCDVIIEAIRTGNLLAVNALRDRSVDRFIEREGGSDLPRDIVAFSVSMGHDFFLTHWNGEPGKPLVTDDKIMGGN
jgi:hypothetical protein